jgi:hypothetical protein
VPTFSSHRRTSVGGWCSCRAGTQSACSLLHQFQRRPNFLPRGLILTLLLPKCSHCSLLRTTRPLSFVVGPQGAAMALPLQLWQGPTLPQYLVTHFPKPDRCPDCYLGNLRSQSWLNGVIQCFPPFQTLVPFPNPSSHPAASCLASSSYATVAAFLTQSPTNMPLALRRDGTMGQTSDGGSTLRPKPTITFSPTNNWYVSVLTKNSVCARVCC